MFATLTIIIFTVHLFLVYYNTYFFEKLYIVSLRIQLQICRWYTSNILEYRSAMCSSVNKSGCVLLWWCGRWSCRCQSLVEIMQDYDSDDDSVCAVQCNIWTCHDQNSFSTSSFLIFWLLGFYVKCATCYNSFISGNRKIHWNDKSNRVFQVCNMAEIVQTARCMINLAFEGYI